MRIYLDPGFKNECTVWFEDGNIQTLKGYPEKICKKIYNYVIDRYEDEDGNLVRCVQVKEVYIDIAGIGGMYEHILNDMLVKTERCTYRKYIS